MEQDLPQNPALRDRIILAIFGSPDVRQIDGLGGADSLTSKLAIIAPARDPGRDIDYTFGAVGIPKAFVDYSANCGNISAAVGPFAVDQGLVRAVEPFTTVKIYNTNTGKMIEAKVPVKEGRFSPEGDYAIDGCPGTGARIDLTFMDPGGAATGRLLPTGHAVDEWCLASGERVAVTIVDAGNPTAFVEAESLRLRGDELPDAFNRNDEARAQLEAIRKEVAGRMGIPLRESIPKIAFVAPSRDYRTLTGRTIEKRSVHLLARVMAMGKMHKTFAITAAIPAAIAAIIPDSVVSRVVFGGSPPGAGQKIVIGHPSGTMEVKVEAHRDQEATRIISVAVGRTARRIMDGRVYISERVYDLTGPRA